MKYILQKSLLLLLILSWKILLVESQDDTSTHEPNQIADDILKCILLNEKVRILIKPLICSEGPQVSKKPPFVGVIVWYQAGDNPLSKPMMA